jgi:hypothetical protein
MGNQEATQAEVLFPQSSHFREGRTSAWKLTIDFIHSWSPSADKSVLEMP